MQARREAQRSEAWPSHQTFLAKRAGDAEAHVLLLTSLLLGFGLNAYACLGTRLDASGTEVEHAWVVTYGGTREAPRVSGWDALSGQTGNYMAFVQRQRIHTCQTIFNAKVNSDL